MSNICRNYFLIGTVRAPVFGTLNSAISNFQTWFVRIVMEVIKYYWMQETSNMQCNYNSFIQIINFHGLFRNALRCRKTGACRILVLLRYFTIQARKVTIFFILYFALRLQMYVNIVMCKYTLVQTEQRMGYFASVFMDLCAGNSYNVKHHLWRVIISLDINTHEDSYI